VVPTQNWRSANTIPRELRLADIKGQAFLASTPVNELAKITGSVNNLYNVNVDKEFDLSPQIKPLGGKYVLNIEMANLQDFTLYLTNAEGNQVIVGYDKVGNTYYTDRTRSGNVGFEKSFARKTIAPRIATGTGLSIKLLIDVASAEVFADDGLSVITNIFFPGEPLNLVRISAKEPLLIRKISYAAVSSSLK